MTARRIARRITAALRRVFGRCAPLGPHRFLPLNRFERRCADCGLTEDLS